MLEKHGLTLLPETRPLMGIWRRDQLAWRQVALYEAQRSAGQARAAQVDAAYPDPGAVLEFALFCLPSVREYEGASLPALEGPCS